MRKLNLGCGNDYKEGWINVDVINVKKDIKHNLDKLPYPFKDNTFDEVLMRMILEHLIQPLEVLREIIRISKRNAKLTVIVPHAFSYAAVTDLQHKTSFTENSFTQNLLRQYELENLKLISAKFMYQNKWKKFIPFKRYLKIFFAGIYEDIVFEFVINK